MPYEFRCEDAGAACSGHFKGATEQELEERVAEHLRKKHKVPQVTKTLRNFVRKVASQR